MSNVAYAVGSKLIISDVDVKVGGRTSRDLLDGETINEDAKPGDNLEIKVKVMNNFTDAEKLKIKNIKVDVTVEGIDDGEDLDEESTEFDLRPGNEKSVTLKFQVPIEVEEESFDVTIHAEGDGDNRTKEEADMRLHLDVNKESHQLKITRATLSPADVSCNRKSVQFAGTVINIGTDDEKDVTVELLNSDFGTDIKDSLEELTAEPNEDASRFSKIYTFNIPETAQSGSYPIIFRALYDDDRKKVEETTTLTLNDCVKLKPVEPDKPKGGEKPVNKYEENQEVQVITPPPTAGKVTAPVTQPEETAPTGTIVTQESPLQSNVFVIGVIVAEFIFFIIGIALVIGLFMRRR